jgi:dihydrofolate reductase
MGLVRIESFTVSLDGYGAGPEQTLEMPMGVGGGNLHGWAFQTATFRAMFGQEGGATGIDDRHARRGFDNIGAWVMGRNMFGPIRGPWPDETWRGWWGEEPPYHCDVFVLTNHARPKLTVGDTTFRFWTQGLAGAVAAAQEAASGRDVRIGGGVATLRAAFEEKLVDRAHLVVSPVLLGKGEAVFVGLDLPGLGYRVASVEAGENASHITLERVAG